MLLLWTNCELLRGRAHLEPIMSAGYATKYQLRMYAAILTAIAKRFTA